MIILTKPDANGIHLLVKKTLVMWVISNTSSAIHSPCQGRPGRPEVLLSLRGPKRWLCPSYPRILPQSLPLPGILISSG